LFVVVVVEVEKWQWPLRVGRMRMSQLNSLLLSFGQTPMIEVALNLPQLEAIVGWLESRLRPVRTLHWRQKEEQQRPKNYDIQYFPILINSLTAA
jgi:hypothetical protein